MGILRSERGHRPRAITGGPGAFGMVELFADSGVGDTSGGRVTRRAGPALRLSYGSVIESGDVSITG